MPDPSPHRKRGSSADLHPDGAHGRNLFQRLVEFLSPGPDSRDELLTTLADAEDRDLIEPESRRMLEGVLRMADMSAGDVMVPAPQMDLIDISWEHEDILHRLIGEGHSRFPVFEGSRDNIVGILMAKDWLKFQRSPDLNLRTLLRPPVYVPESKRLNELLRDFRSNRNHLAMVVDEFGAIAGLVTIEDVLEEIVGEIEDEFDDTAAENRIYTLADGTYRVAGDTPIDDVNRSFGVSLPVEVFDTVGGLVSHDLGRVPRRGESVSLLGLRLTVMLTRGGSVRWFKVVREQDSDDA